MDSFCPNSLPLYLSSLKLLPMEWYLYLLKYIINDLPLRELTDLSAREYIILSGLEVTFHDQASIVDQPILVDYVEYLFIDIDEPGWQEETTINFQVIEEALL